MATNVNPTLRDMVNKTRSFLRGSNFNDEAQIIRAIQRFMDFTLPYSVNIQIFRTTWAFSTEEDMPNYTKPSKYITIGKNRRLYVDGYPRHLTSDLDEFKNSFKTDYYPRREEVIGRGDGSATYSIQLTSQRIHRGVASPDGNVRPRFFLRTTLSSGASALGEDDGVGNIVGTGIAAGSTIDYPTGNLNINFTEDVSEDQDIKALYSTYTKGSPFIGFFQNDVLELRPVPDRGYVVELDAYVKPTVLLEEDRFLNYEWLFDFITLGAARRIFEELGNNNKLDRTEKTFEEYKAYVNNRASRQETTTQEIRSGFSDALERFDSRYYY